MIIVGIILSSDNIFKISIKKPPLSPVNYDSGNKMTM